MTQSNDLILSYLTLEALQVSVPLKQMIGKLEKQVVDGGIFGKGSNCYKDGFPSLATQEKALRISS